MSSQRICPCRFCGERYTPQGIENHERWCDDNDNRGMCPDRQQELGLLDTEGASDAAANPDPDQSDRSGGSGGLPPVSVLSEDKEPPEASGLTATDGGEPEECPRCGSSDVMDASAAKSAYLQEVGDPHPRAVLAYELAAKTCNEPECATCWGDEYHEPIPMAVILDA